MSKLNKGKVVMNKSVIHTIRQEDLNPDGTLRSDFVLDVLKGSVKDQGIDPNRVGFIPVTETPEGPMSVPHKIYCDKEYTLVYKSDKKPKRKVIKKLNGSKLLMYIEKFDSSYQQLLKDNPNENINELRQFHNELTMGVLETWGHQQLGLDVKHPFISKEIKRDVKKGSDRSLTSVYGWFGKKLSIENEEKEFSKGCDISTIEVTKSITTDEDIKEMIPSIPDQISKKP